MNASSSVLRRLRRFCSSTTGTRTSRAGPLNPGRTLDSAQQQYETAAKAGPGNGAPLGLPHSSAAGTQQLPTPSVCSSWQLTSPGAVPATSHRAVGGQLSSVDSTSQFPSLPPLVSGTGSCATGDAILLESSGAASVATEPGTRAEASGESWSPHSLLNSIAPEIVLHAHEAPMLHLVFSRPQEASRCTVTSTRQRLSSASVDCPKTWSALKRHVQGADPDGVVLVHRLAASALTSPECRCRTVFRPDPECEERCPLGEGCVGPKDTWALVVLGRGQPGKACFVLQTTRVSSPAGAATHYSFANVKSLASTIEEQIESSWLVTKFHGHSSHPEAHRAPV